MKTTTEARPPVARFAHLTTTSAMMDHACELLEDGQIIGPAMAREITAHLEWIASRIVPPVDGFAMPIAGETRGAFGRDLGPADPDDDEHFADDLADAYGRN